MTGTSIMKLTPLTLADAFLLIGLLFLAVGCSVDKGANAHRKCGSDDDCDSGTECYKGFCVAKEAAGSSGSGGKGGSKDDGGVAIGDGGVHEDGGETGDGAVDGGPIFVDPKEGMDCDERGKVEACFPETDHPETFVTGECKAGLRTCGCPGEEKDCKQLVWSNCFGLTLPEDEKCNGKDDDCDGESDEDVAVSSSCSVAGQKGVCAEGEERCDRDRGFLVCDQVKTAAPEECNGKDDDCDDELDEDTMRLCYDDAADGCTLDADGYHCKGLCKPGFQQCDSKKGEYGDCEGAVMPSADGENCDPKPPGEAATDEDCDDRIDEQCSCNPADTYDCFTGQPAAAQHAPCHAGTQTCSQQGKLEGDCDGQVLPGVETCTNDGVDDDCDGSQDNVMDRGDPCTVQSNKGICRSGTQECKDGALKCITPEPDEIAETCNGLDDDCDGDIDDGFDVQTDPLNCGECGHKCQGGTVCCSGLCVDTQSDANNCKTCGTRCGAGGICCGGACKNANSDAANCKTCGNDCTLLGLLGACCSGKCNSLGCGG